MWHVREGGETHTRFFLGEPLKETNHLEELGLDGEKLDGCVLRCVWIGEDTSGGLLTTRKGTYENPYSGVNVGIAGQMLPSQEGLHYTGLVTCLVQRRSLA
jgi:hypothetical protein